MGQEVKGYDLGSAQPSPSPAGAAGMGAPGSVVRAAASRQPGNEPTGLAIQPAPKPDTGGLAGNPLHSL